MRALIIIGSFLVASPALGAWTMSRFDNKMDGTTRVLISSAGDEPYPGNILRHAKPSLYIKCEAGKVDLVVNAEVTLGNNTGQLETHAVRLRFDNGKPERHLATESTSGSAAFLPNPRPLIRRLLKTRVLMIEVTPFRMANAVSTFDVSGLGEYANVLAKDCGIK